MSVEKENRSVCVHDGCFHLDEVTAVAMLGYIYNCKVTRSRSPNVWVENDFLVDVGGQFDYHKGRFDHHQRGFAESMNSLQAGPFVTKLSSAGLVYACFGLQVIEAIAPNMKDASLEQKTKVFHRVYAKFIEPIDAHDNGIPQYEGKLPEPRFDSGYTNLHAIVKLLNAKDMYSTDQHTAFFQTVQLVAEIFKNVVLDVVIDWLPAETAVTKAASEAIALGWQYILLDRYYPSVQEFVEAVPGNESLLYVIFKDDDRNHYFVKCITNKGKEFENRKSLCESWRGLNGTDLHYAIGNTVIAQGMDHLPDRSFPTGAVFVHASGFLGAHESQEGAICMALMSAKD